MWIMCLIIGIVMGAISFLMDILTSTLVDLRWSSTETTARENAGVGWIVIVLFSVLLLGIASVGSLYMLQLLLDLESLKLWEF